MANIPSKPVVEKIEWINGQTKLNHTNLTAGVNDNLDHLKTAVDGIIDAMGGPGSEPASDKTLGQSTISAYNPATTYSQGQVVIHNDADGVASYYRCNESGVTGTWNENKWSKIGLSAPVDAALDEDSPNPVQNAVVAEAILDVLGDIAPEYDASETYSEGDLVIHERVLYKANQDIATAEAWNAAHWTRTSVVEAAPENFEEITYAALKALRDGGNLVPGKLYRITDYMTTATKKDTRSAGHQFDVIVQALSADSLSEEAYAALHAGDTYFANSNLGAWRIWYSIDNDTSRFDWADATNGKGIIYRMIDEKGNDLPYDFKNIQFRRYKGAVVTEGSNLYPKFINMHDYYADVQGSERLANRAQKAYEMLRTATKNRLNTNASPFLYSLGATQGYETVGNLSEDVANFLTDASHGALSNDDYVIAICGEEEYDGYLCVLAIDSSTDFYFYTFSDGSSSSSTGAITSIADESLKSGVFSNVFKVRESGYSLQPNIFIGSIFYDNTIGNGFSLNTVGDNFYYNVIGNAFDGNTVGNGFCRNTVGNYFNYNTVGNGFDSNVVRDFFYYNVTGGAYNHNTVGDNFYSNAVEREFHHNTIENDFSGNVMGSYFTRNTVGNNFIDNVVGGQFNSNDVGNDFQYNTVGDEFGFNVVGNYFVGNTVGSNFGSNVVGNSFESNTVGDNFELNAVGSGFYNNTIGTHFVYNTVGNVFDSNIVGSLSDGAFVSCCAFEDGVQWISLTSPDPHNNEKTIQNVHIHLGVKGASEENPLVISVPRALPYETEYYLDDLGNLTVSNFSTRITWEKLKALRDAGRLVPGKQYRIIDYLTAVEQPECRSAGHPFDIIVTALTANTLSEDAKAVVRDGDDYFGALGTAGVWKPGITISDVETLYKVSGDEGEYHNPDPRERTFTRMGMMTNPLTGAFVPYLFEPDPDDSGNDRNYIFVGEYEFDGETYDQWQEFRLDGTPEPGYYYQLTNLVVDMAPATSEKIKLSAWKLKYCLDNDYDRFGFAVRHEVIRVRQNDDTTYLYLRYPSLDGDNGLAWAYVDSPVNTEIEDPSVDYDSIVTDDIIYTPNLSINVGDELSMSGTPVTVDATRIGKGVVYEMEDEWGNKLPYDFKNVQFKRYRVTLDDSAYGGFDEEYVGCKSIGGYMASPRGYIIENDTDFKWCYTFNWYNEDAESEDYSIVGNISLYDGDDFIAGCYKNVFGVCLEYYDLASFETRLARMYLGNNVIWDAYSNDHGMSYGFYSNIVGNNFRDNTMGNNFKNNTVGNNFYSNTVEKDFHSNEIEANFYSNTVGTGFVSNTIGVDFKDDTVGSYFQWNTVGIGFTSNTVGNYFQYNTVGNDFRHNTVGNYFQYSTVGNFFYNNTMADNFRHNTVGNSFRNNIGGDYIYYSSMKDGVQYITLDAPSGSTSNKLQYITIGPSVKGASSSNPLAITPTRNANYEQEYVNAAKVVNQVTVS